VRSAALLVLAWLATGCGPISIHTERTIHMHNVVCTNPQDESTCHEVKPDSPKPEVESP